MKVNKTQLRSAVRAVADGLIGGGPLTVPPVVGLREINKMFGNADTTAYQWRSRGVLPPQDGTISGNPIWKVPTIYAWADATDRTIIWDPWGIAHQAGDPQPIEERQP